MAFSSIGWCLCPIMKILILLERFMLSDLVWELHPQTKVSLLCMRVDWALKHRQAFILAALGLDLICWTQIPTRMKYR